MEVKGVREVKPGKWEVCVSHRLLPNGRAFRTFEDQETAVAFKRLAVLQLQGGKVPAELSREAIRTASAPKPRQIKSAPAIRLHSTAVTVGVKSVLAQYMAADNVKIPASDRELLAFLHKALDGPVQGITAAWTDSWVRQMKREQRLSPGTIRKRVESLARCIDWWHRATHTADEMPANPLRQLPRGYSTYGPTDGEAKRDVERDRRLEPGEQERIEAVIMGQRRPDRERPWCPGGDQEFLVLFRLLVATGLRLREAYMLRVESISFPLRTIHVRRSKTGAKRDVPMTSAVAAMLREQIGSKTGQEPVFSFWGGSEDERALRLVTARLSARFRSLFAYAECHDLVEHDLRHEATCRWMELRDHRGGWLFRPEEVRKITGHKTEAMFMRYLSLRGSDLASRLE